MLYRNKIEKMIDFILLHIYFLSISVFHFLTHL
jgi:hypothetical protein